MDTGAVEKLKMILDVIDRIGIATGNRDLSMHGLNVLFTASKADMQGKPLESNEIARLVNITASAVSRQVASMGEWHQSQRPGLGLIYATPDLDDRRRKPVKLTLKGQKAVAAILKEI